MTTTDTTGSGWRARWADRKNEGRQRAYDAAVEAWRLRDDELQRLRAAAAEFGGFAGGEPEGVPAGLESGEAVLCVLPAAELVEAEARHIAGLPAPGVTVDPVPVEALVSKLPRGLKVTDAGIAFVTDRRVVFEGRRGDREWPYAEMTGLAHHPAVPFTLVHVRNRQELSGLLVPPAAAPDFRFNLTLAFADAVEQRDVVVAQLDELIDAHERSRPSAPVVVTPDQAPLTALVSRGRLAVAAAVAIVLIALVGAFQADPSERAQADAGTAPTGPTTAASAGTTATTTTAGTSATAGTAATPAAAPSGTALATAGGTSGVSRLPVPPATREHAAGGPPVKSPPPKPTRSTAAPTPTVTGLCGAPDNPYGYNYCGGSYIHDPASDVCDYFDCVDDFWEGKGYMIQCGDGMVSMMGGRTGSCAGHNGERRPVYQ